MLYRTDRKTGNQISQLGYGAMRLPVNSDGTINEKEAIACIRHAIDEGVNYVDTAYMYHNGTSEAVVGKALKDGYREKTNLASKLPLGMIFAGTAGTKEEVFAEQLRRLDTDYIDFYLAHDINDHVREKFESEKIYDYLAALKAEGKVKRIGFSYHGETFEFFKELIDKYDWDFCQIQYNYMDEEYQAGTKGLEYACEKGLSVVVMEPLRGGKLTVKVPEDVKAIWDNAPIKRTPAEWGLRWVANHPQVTTILSGMSNMQQVEENLKILGQAKANELSGEELAIIEKAAETYRARNLYGCTNCKYCMPCTQEISIPDVIDARNEADIYAEKMHGVFAVNVLLDRKPSECIECGLCEPKCPQHLPIIKIMKEAAELFERK